MPIVEADIEFRLSINTGPGDSAAQPDANDSLGGFLSTTEYPDATLHNLFDKVTGEENRDEVVDYRCLFVVNTHATLTWETVVVWIEDATAGGAIAAIALDGVGVTDTDSAVAQADVIADELTPPTGEAFSAPVTKETGLAVGDVGPGQCFAVWVRRTATDSAAQDLDGVAIRAEGDTAD